MTASFRFLLCIALFILWMAPSSGMAAEEGGVGADPSAGRLEEIRLKLENIERLQQELAAKDEKILEELDRLRVWVRRQ